jgi:hypothetical protein
MAFLFKSLLSRGLLAPKTFTEFFIVYSLQMWKETDWMS